MTYAIYVTNPISGHRFRWAKDIETLEKAEELKKEAEPLFEVKFEVVEE